jgi:hypothetical protein
MQPHTLNKHEMLCFLAAPFVLLSQAMTSIPKTRRVVLLPALSAIS